MREDGIDWIIEHHVRGQDHTAAIQKRHSIQNQADRARHLYLAGEIDWRSFTVARSQAEAELVGTHMVETGESRTPRPETPLIGYATSLFGALISLPPTPADKIRRRPADKIYGPKYRRRRGSIPE